MNCIIDIEANSLTKPTKIHLVVCKDIDTNRKYIFRNITDNDKELSSFIHFSNTLLAIIGHNILDYDCPVLCYLIPQLRPIYGSISNLRKIDTLVVSKLVDYSRPGGHSLEQYGEEIGLPKFENDHTGFFSKWSEELEVYCERDVDINHQVYLRYKHIIDDPAWAKAIETEHRFVDICNDLHVNGFAFDTKRASDLLSDVEAKLSVLDKEIEYAFPPKVVPGKTILPRLTKYGTLNKNDFRWYKDTDYTAFTGGEFQLFSYRPFNPSSPRQIVEVLNQAGWVPTEKTKAHVEAEREVNRNKNSREHVDELQLQRLSDRLEQLKITGWKINEKNLETLPPNAPAPARTLAKRILLESRRRTLVEWLKLVTDDHRIHGKFVSIGAWTHRMAHQQPNMANIPNPQNQDGTTKLLGKELRSLWRAPRKRLLVGVDAEGIQLRIFAHYVNDRELTESLINGRKDNKTDPHSLNQRVLGSICKTRAAAKRFLYALLLGGGIGKFAEILGCSKEQAKEAFDTFIKRYPGFDKLRQEQFPIDAKRGYFEGLDGRKVRIPGDNLGDRRHLAMSGYLQNGEAVIMKMACLKWEKKLHEYDATLVNFVHDEWQTEVPNNMAIALVVAEMQSDSLREVGEELNLNCPMAGSYWNEDARDYTIGTTWYQTH